MIDSTLEARWKAVLDDWHDDAAHGAFLEYCQKSDQLLEAAVRYRGMAGDRNRGPSADKRLAAISLLAMSRLEAARSTPRGFSPTISRVAIAVFFVGALVAFLVVWRVL